MTELTFTGYERTKKGRYSLFFDDDFLFSISEDSFASTRLVKGNSYPVEYIEKLRLDDEYISCKQRAMAILSTSAQSEYRLYGKLVKYFSPSVVDATIERMKELALLNDADYARKYTADATKLKGFSKRRIAQDLKKRGINNELVQQTMEDIAEYDEVDSIVKLIAKKYSHKLSDTNSRQKVIAALARRGFGFSAIKKAMERFSEECDISFDNLV